MPTYHAPCAPGLEEVLATEIGDLGATDVERRNAGVGFTAPRTVAYSVCLWSRTALRVFEQLATGPCRHPDEAYELAKTVTWQRYLTSSLTIAVYASVPGHTKFAAQRVKDGVVDQMREETGRRPDVDIKNPDLPLKLVVRDGIGVLSRDLAGDALYRRGWRQVQVKSPLNESLAAGLILLTGWDKQTPMVDPMCGSGTLLIEAAHIAGDRAPGLKRRFAFERWPDFEQGAWFAMKGKADDRWKAGRGNIPPLQGADRHPGAIDIAKTTAAAAEVGDAVQFTQQDVASWTPDPLPGIVVTNPPYGKRIGEGDDLIQSWHDLGTFFHETCPSRSVAWVLSGNPETTRHVRMRASLKVPVKNTSIDCRWLRYEIG